MPEGVWNLPNKITLSRLALSAGLFTILALIDGGTFSGSGTWGWLAFSLFVVAAATDWVDGYVARKYQMVTAFGRIMDPFVDKVVVCGTFVFLTAIHPDLVPAWMVVVILAREFFVNAIRGFMESRGVNFSAEMPGKIKMALQCVAIGGVLFLQALPASLSGVQALSITAQVLVWAALLSTIHSGAYYAKKAFAKLAELGP